MSRKLVKWLFLGLATMFAVVDIAGAIALWGNLPGCTGNFLNGIYCPPDVQSSLLYRTKHISTGIWFNGMVASVLVGVPLAIIALVIEARTRWNAP